MPADDEALIPIEKPTGLHRYVMRYMPMARSPGNAESVRIHQQQWSVVDFTTTSNGVERLEWRDVPLVYEDVDGSIMRKTESFSSVINRWYIDSAGRSVEERRKQGLPDYEKPPLGQPPAFLQEQEPKAGGGITFKCKEDLDAYLKETLRDSKASLSELEQVGETETIVLSEAATKAWNEPGKARVDRVDISLAKQLQHSMERNVSLFARNSNLIAELRKLQGIIDGQSDRIVDLLAQLPEGMKHCTIELKHCPNGRPCPGCDGHECDNGCAYPGAIALQPSEGK